MASAFWAQYDRTLYVVSTLNVPTCVERQHVTGTWRALALSGERLRYETLASVLQERGARIFDVLSSNVARNLFFIVARTATGRPLGVYAYKMGWALPRSVVDPGCIALAPPNVVHAYDSGRYTLVAHFTSTLPTLD